MKLSMEIIQEYLKQYRFVQVFGRETGLTLESIRLLYDNMNREEPLNSKYLYMGIVQDGQRLSGEWNDITIIICGTLDNYDHIDHSANLYVMEGDVDFGKVFNDVAQTFSFYNKWEEELNNLCFSAASLQEFIDISDKVLPYPISIEDHGERTLAFSKNKKCEDDRGWDYLESVGYLKTEYLLRDNIHSADIAKNIYSTQYYTEASNRYIILHPIIVHQHTVAFLVVHKFQEGKEPFSSGTLQLSYYLARSITTRMCSDEYYGLSMGEAAEYFFADLISRKVVESSIISDRSVFFKQPMVAERFLLIIRARKNKEPLSRRKITSLREQLQSMFPYADYCTYDSSIIMIERITGALNKSFVDNDNLHKFITEHGLVCGVSSVYRHLEQTADYYDQARAAIRFGEAMDPKCDFYLFSDYSYMYLLEELDKKIDLRTLVHPIVDHLISAYGEDHVILPTLRNYLLYERNITNSAKSLFVHRNTMLYRVEQLCQRLDYDFSNPEERMTILQSFKVLDYIHIIKAETYTENEKRG